MKDLKPFVEWHLDPRFGKKIYVKVGRISPIASFPTSQVIDRILEVAQ